MYHVHLTTFLYGSDLVEYITNLHEMTVSSTKQERFMWTEVNFTLGKNEHHAPSGLGIHRNKKINCYGQTDKSL